MLISYSPLHANSLIDYYKRKRMQTETAQSHFLWVINNHILCVEFNLNHQILGQGHRKS